MRACSVCHWWSRARNVRSDEDARGRQHDPRDQGGQAGKQQKLAQDCGHVPLRLTGRRRWAGGRLGPRPGRVCLVLLTPVDEGRGGPDLAAMHEARRPPRRCKRSGFAPAARRCGSGSSRPLAACGGAPSSRACAAPRLDAATSQSRRTSRSIARPNRRDCPALSSRADCPTGPTCVDACHAGRPQAAI